MNARHEVGRFPVSTSRTVVAEIETTDDGHGRNRTRHTLRLRSLSTTGEVAITIPAHRLPELRRMVDAFDREVRANAGR